MRRYLFVDDNSAFAENLAEIVRDNGDEADVATSGEQALRKVGAAAAPYDAILTDMRMPGMGGAELVARVRLLDPGLPALVATAYTEDAMLRAAEKAGLLAVLAKPVPFDRLFLLLGQARRDGHVALLERGAGPNAPLAEALRLRGFSPLIGEKPEDVAGFKAAPFAAVLVERSRAAELLAKLPPTVKVLPLVLVGALGDAPADPPWPVAARFDDPQPLEPLLEALERLHAGAKAP